MARYFHECSYKLAKQDPILNKNVYLNIAEELKEPFDELTFNRKETGNTFSRYAEYINQKVILEYEVAFGKYINEMNRIQS